MEIAFSEFLNNLAWWQLALLSLVFAFGITYISIPAIVTVSKHLNLFEHTTNRGSHNGSIPTLGGVAIFAGVVISGAIFFPDSIFDEYRYVLAGLVILFFTGVKDDLLVIDPKKKLFAQIVVALILVVLGDFRITTFQGFVGIYEIPYLVSVILSIFFYLVLINGFNLIDGIDGLASGVAILVSTAFAVLFIVDGQYDFAFEPIVLAGALIAFFIFNVFSKKNKIFLGDTGSLTIGFLIAVVAINFLECDHEEGTSQIVKSVPAMTFAILIVPLFDTLRVFVLRIFGGTSPFQADRKHIHHRLLDLGYSHLRATLKIIAANIIIVGVVLLLQDLRGSLLVLIIMGVSAALSYIPVWLVDNK